MTPEEEINQVCADLKITMESKFIPFSKSRFKNEKTPSLNWEVTLSKDGKPFLTFPYTAGYGNCPSYKQGKQTIFVKEAIAFECEQGRAFRETSIGLCKGKPILPVLASVIYSMVGECDAINYSTFEEWAFALGYYEDSRQAEKVYRSCLETSLKVRNTVGDAGLEALQKACQDY